ncbi:hypothetical protein EG329_007586 [Mollisiaceae sp. DMI_Dod_QoI]|nr:hypothetical protein EG329_007586 [Helotiales sp. DMI_Dod_QoI]
MLPLFGEKQAIEFFSNLALMNEVRRECNLPTPREAYILESINSCKRLWLRDPAITINPIAEGVRLATLLYRHASQMETDREFFIKAYFPACFMMSNIDGKWVGKEEERQRFCGPFLNSAALAFHELAKKDGYWDVGMDG